MHSQDRAQNSGYFSKALDGGLGDRAPERHSVPKSMKAFLRGLVRSGSRMASPKPPSEGRKSGVARREVR